MVKNKNLGKFEFVKALWDYSTFTKTFTLSNIIIYNLAILLLIGIVNIIGYNKYSGFSLTGTFFGIIIGTPIILLLGYLFYAIFLNAFEGKSEKFWEGFLVFNAIMLPFILIGHILNLIASNSLSSAVGTLTGLLIFIVLIYFVICFIQNYKNYYKTTGYRILASLILADLIFITLAIVMYFSIIYQNLNGL